MLYELGQFAWPGVNAVFYALAFAIVVLSGTGAFAIFRFCRDN